MTAGRRLTLLVASPLLATACAAGSTVPSSPGTAISTPGATSTAIAAVASPAPTIEASLGPSATPAPAPRAEIVTADATVAGTLGTYTIDDGGSDSPWLPFDTLPAVGLGAAEKPEIRFVDGVAIGQLQAEIAAAADTTGSALREVSGVVLGQDGRSGSIGPLPVGRWVLEARVFRLDGRGDGLTFWAVTVR